MGADALPGHGCHAARRLIGQHICRGLVQNRSAAAPGSVVLFRPGAFFCSHSLNAAIRSPHEAVPWQQHRVSHVLFRPSDFLFPDQCLFFGN